MWSFLCLCGKMSANSQIYATQSFPAFIFYHSFSKFNVLIFNDIFDTNEYKRK